MLTRVKGFVEFLHIDFERHLAEHLNEAAVAIVGEARVAGLGGEALGGFVVEAKVEDGVHHARHGEPGAGAHAEQKRIGGIAQLLAEFLLQVGGARVAICFFDSAGTTCLLWK